MPVTSAVGYNPLIGRSGCRVFRNKERKNLPLIELDAHTTILSSLSRTTLTQTFENPTDEPLPKAQYAFPLYDGVTVVSYACTIGSQVIKGVVKEREEAKKKFDEAASRGEQAGLLEQSTDATDVFTATLGNVGPKETVKIEIAFIGELKHDAETDGLRYTLPTFIAPRYGADQVLATAVTPKASDESQPARINFTVDVDMGTGATIKSIQSPSHPISVNIGSLSAQSATPPSLEKASASFALEKAALDKDFVIQICANQLGHPTAVVEEHPTIENRQALMTTLVPRFNLPIESPEVVFICDRSGSMGTGQRIPNLISALQVFLKSLPTGILFNICSFGSKYEFLWKESQPYNQATLDEAIQLVKTFDSGFGGTEMLKPVLQTFKQRATDRNLEVFLLTDGQIWNQQVLFDEISKAVTVSNGAIRMFSLGIGNEASSALIEGIARAGKGFSQTVGEDEKLDKKVIRMLKGALTAHVLDYSLELKYEDAEDGNDGFELVERVKDLVTVHESVKSEDKPMSDMEEESGQTGQPTSLHDPDLKNEDMEMLNQECPPASHSSSDPLPEVDRPQYLQAPYEIPALFPFNRTNVYVLLSEHRPRRGLKSVILKGTSKHGPLELEIAVAKFASKGTTVHQLAARKAIQDLEDDRGWIPYAKVEGDKLAKEVYPSRIADLSRQEGVKLGIEYQVSNKWCSFVAVKDKESDPDQDDAGDFEVVRPEKQNNVLGFGGGGVFAASRFRHRRILTTAVASHTQPVPAASPAPAGPTTFGAGSNQLSTPESSSDGKQTEDTDSPRGASDENADTNNPIHRIASLQSFEGSWKWSSELEDVIGVTRDRASSVQLSNQGGDEETILATLCAVVYLRKKNADERDIWELFVEKAERWISEQAGKDAKELEGLVEGLFQ